MVVYCSLGLTSSHYQAIVVIRNACVLHACTFTTCGIQLLLVDLKQNWKYWICRSGTTHTHVLIKIS